jgi:hypothetical protein
MAGYPVHRRPGASTAMLMALNGHHVNPLARTLVSAATAS